MTDIALSAWLGSVCLAGTIALVLAGVQRVEPARHVLAFAVAATAFFLGFAGRGSTGWVVSGLGWMLVLFVGVGHGARLGLLRLNPAETLGGLWIGWALGWLTAAAPYDPWLLWPPRYGTALPEWSRSAILMSAWLVSLAACHLVGRRDVLRAIAVAGGLQVGLGWLAWALLPWRGRQ